MGYEKKNKRFISKPVFEGGERELRKFIYKNLRYPADQITEGKTGEVSVKIDISAKGKVVGTRVLKGMGRAFDEEAERVLSLLRFNIPGTGARKGKMLFHRTFKVKFTPPKVEKNSSTQTLTYTVTTATPTQPTEDSSGGSYGYTISW